jgi:hypothetical protein
MAFNKGTSKDATLAYQGAPPSKKLEFAGDYHLPYIHLINHKGQGISPDTHGQDITPLMIEFNIYESIFSSSVTGSIVIVDTQNLIARLPIQGTERLSFKLTTKLENDTTNTVIDCTESNGTAMHIYAVTDKSQLSDTTLTYTIQFASREFVRNLRTRVSESFEGRMDQMVNKIFSDPNYLDSSKTLYYQKTRNQDKIVVPNLNPFAAIGMMCQRSLPDIYRSKGAGYLFYETTKGFHFRSWESLCVNKNGAPRKVKQKFRYVQGNLDHRVGRHPDGHDFDRITETYKNVRSYKFINNFHDVAANTTLGTYGHRVITHNIYDKSYREDDYNYHNSWNKTNHLHKFPSITDSPVDYDTKDDSPYQKGVSDYPESRVTLQPTTRFSHNEDTGHFGTEVTDDGKLEAGRMAQVNKVHQGTKLEMTINGQTRLQAGDLIEFDLQSVENKVNSRGRLDPYYSGRYIITDIRHRVAQEKFLQVLTCVKDSNKTGYGYANKSYTEISGGAMNIKGRSKDIDQQDEQATDSGNNITIDPNWHPGA